MTTNITPDEFAFTNVDRGGNPVALYVNRRPNQEELQFIASIGHEGTLVELDPEAARLLSYWLAANTPSPSDAPGPARCPECDHLMSEHGAERGCTGILIDSIGQFGCDCTVGKVVT